MSKEPNMTTPKNPGDALLSCPFCPDHGMTHYAGEAYMHQLNGCILRGMIFTPKQWNTRAAPTPAPIDVEELKESLYRPIPETIHFDHKAIEDYNDTVSEIIDHLHALGHLQTPVPEAERLKDTLRDVLKAIVSDRHAVQDTIWVNGSPVGDFIMCALDEEIDLDELQNAPYRCKQTGDLPLHPPAPVTQEAAKMALDEFKAAESSIAGWGFDDLSPDTHKTIRALLQHRAGKGEGE